MSKIALLGLFKDQNLGDPLICKVVKKLYNSIETVQWEEIDLRYYRNRFHYINRFHRFCERLFLYFLGKMPFSFTLDLKIKIYSHKMKSLLGNCDRGVIAGGGIIHYKFHDYCIGICAFIRASYKINIPIIVNAVGIEGYDSKLPRCKMFSKYLSFPNVKMISTRDDVSTLKNNYHVTCPHIYQVIDPVALSSRFFQIPLLSSSKIGIGIIRKSVISDYRIDTSPDKLYNYYAELILLLERMGIEYELFSNGYKMDLDIIQGVETILNRHFDVKVPKTEEELIETIVGYRGVITARMHSCIIAYAYKRPAVAFEWNKKISFWFQNINRPYACIPYEDLSAESALNNFLRLENEGYDENLRARLENKYLEVLKKGMLLSNRR